MFAALSANDYGVFDGLVKAIVPALGEVGIAYLKNRLAQALANAGSKAGGRDGRASAMRHARRRKRMRLGTRGIARLGNPGQRAFRWRLRDQLLGANEAKPSRERLR